MKVPDWQKRAMELAIRRVRLETASLSRIPTGAEEPLPKTEAEVDAFIKARLTLYTESWIVPLLEAVRDGDHATAKQLLPK